MCALSRTTLLAAAALAAALAPATAAAQCYPSAPYYAPTTAGYYDTAPAAPGWAGYTYAYAVPGAYKQSGGVYVPTPATYHGVTYAPRWTAVTHGGGAPSPYYMGGAVHTLHARGYDSAMHR